MTINWKELAAQKPHEIVLSGDRISEQVEAEDCTLNEIVFGIKSLNFLEVTNTPTLKTISCAIHRLENLTNLVLQGNKLSSIPAEIGSLTKLKCLDLSRNQLTELPADLFARLTALQTLNLEQNQLSSLPDMCELSSLIKLKFGSNAVTAFPASLCDRIRKVPDASATIAQYDGGAIHLAELMASHNEIETIPASIRRLVALKTLDLSYNRVTRVPGELSDCSKLKELCLKTNPIKDRRLYKLIEQCPTKKVLDYVRANVPFEAQQDCGKSGKSKSAADGDGDDQHKDEDENGGGELDGGQIEFSPSRSISVQHQVDAAQSFRVIATKQILQMRKIVACILRDVDLSNPKVMKKFIQVQTKLHQGICDNRQKATIATHDLAKILPPPLTYASLSAASGAAPAPTLPGPVHPVPTAEKKPKGGGKKGGKEASFVTEASAAAANKAQSEARAQISPSTVVYFDGRVPTKIKLLPLGRATEMTAMEMYRTLNDEADQYRKEKKRNTISGIHKYLHLLKGKSLFPVLLDHTRAKVISLPPLTNADYSKITATTRDVFVEVTGESVPTCRDVMNHLICEFLSIESPISDGGDQDSSPPLPSAQRDAEVKCKFATIIPAAADGTTGSLIIEPVIVETVEGELVVKYPSKIDLQFDNVKVSIK